MARKKAGKMPETTEPKTKPIRLDLPPATHRLLRKVAADEGVSMAAFARMTVDRVVHEEARRRGIKS